MSTVGAAVVAEFRCGRSADRLNHGDVECQAKAVSRGRPFSKGVTLYRPRRRGE
jgi:hypothetical protein